MTIEIRVLKLTGAYYWFPPKSFQYRLKFSSIQNMTHGNPRTLRHHIQHTFSSIAAPLFPLPGALTLQESTELTGVPSTNCSVGILDFPGLEGYWSKERKATLYEPCP